MTVSAEKTPAKKCVWHSTLFHVRFVQRGLFKYNFNLCWAAPSLANCGGWERRRLNYRRRTKDIEWRGTLMYIHTDLWLEELFTTPYLPWDNCKCVRADSARQEDERRPGSVRVSYHGSPGPPDTNYTCTCTVAAVYLAVTNSWAIQRPLIVPCVYNPRRRSLPLSVFVCMELVQFISSFFVNGLPEQVGV